MADAYRVPLSVVDVVAAEAVDSDMDQVVAELTRLEHELLVLTVEAEQLECEVQMAHRGSTDASAPSLLEHVFAAEAVAARAALQGALDDAVLAAETRVAAARSEVQSVCADIRTIARRPASDEPEPVLRRAAEPSTPPARSPVNDMRAAPPPAREDFGEPLTGRAVTMEAEPAAFGRFWDGALEPSVPARTQSRTAIVDAVLPVLAVVIMVVFALSWMG